MKRRAYTVIEVLIASGIMAFIIMLGMGIIALMSSFLYDGQIESSNRSELNDCIFFITREIQSAENIKIENSGKKLLIKQSGSDGYNLVYEIKEDYPTDALCFKDKKLIDIDYDGSVFEKNDTKIIISLNLLKNNIELNQKSKKVKFSVVPRGKGAIVE